MARAPLPTWTFALVVVRLGSRFLMVQEKKYGATWTIPGGRVEPGEQLSVAAMREVREEAGVQVRLEGVLRVEHHPQGEGARMRVIYIASPIDDSEPKQLADAESLRAAYLTLPEIRLLPHRGHDLVPLLDSLERGRAIYPLDVIGSELAI
jgi:ADP-ribose pyrophosphatase YjhB (NUDIX family)